MSDTKFMEEYTEMIIEECRKALHPELRDMISRGQAFDLIKKHFEKSFFIQATGLKIYRKTFQSVNFRWLNFQDCTLKISPFSV